MKLYRYVNEHNDNPCIELTNENSLSHHNWTSILKMFQSIFFSNLGITIKYGYIVINWKLYMLSQWDRKTVVWKARSPIMVLLLKWTWQHRALDKNVNGYDVWENAQ